MPTGERSLAVIVCGMTAGTLWETSAGKMRYAYEDGYDGPDLSLAMPVEPGRVWHERDLRPWFDGLLPDDRNVRARMARRAGCGPDDTLGLLGHYGRELPGAVQVVSDPGGASDRGPSGYERVDDGQIALRLSEAAAGRSPWPAPKERWSLGGWQAKIALARLGGEWYSCVGDAPSTHIVKPGVEGMPLQALDEYFCMRLARACGVAAAYVEYRAFDGIPAIVVERYDRRLADGRVVRLHQEDMCQALSCPPTRKYASDGGPNTDDILALLMERGTAADVEDFVYQLAFNYFVGATDAHGKNFSVLHPGGHAVRLAPAYDVASILPYVEDRSRPYRMAMGVAGERRFGWVRRSKLDRMDARLGLPDGYSYGIFNRVGSLVMEQAPAVFEEGGRIGGMGELAGHMLPRLEGLCKASLANLDRDGRDVEVPNIYYLDPSAKSGTRGYRHTR